MNLVNFLILAQTPVPAAKPANPGLDGFHMMAWMAFAFALIYFMSIRPQAKKQKELQARVNSLKTGDKVVTTGGVHGIISNVKDGPTLTLKLSEGKMEVDKTAIAHVITPDSGRLEGSPSDKKS